jgi:hypothetical protein
MQGNIQSVKVILILKEHVSHDSYPFHIIKRDEYESQFGPGTGPLVLARTDALKTDGFEAGIERCLAFREVGCDMTFLEAPESVKQMKE